MKTNTVLLLMGVGAIVACNDPKGDVENDTLADATADTAVMYEDERGRMEADGAEIIDVGEDFWAGINWDAPVVDDPDLKGSNVEMRQEKEYNIYTMDDRLLFDTDKAQIRAEGEEKLRQIVNELKDLPQNGQIRIFGHADARASNEYNKELSAERANAVKDWLQNKGGIAANRLSIEAMGETAPRATNETARGRQLNRRVAIVAVTREQM
ncbi:outer membrane protein OmpA-like peptidoglycan-associated protein [Pontibacter aydingkolensis]|uniref:OmpA family protein n=1 Tax=Pontibacter aydingkolensis TaxID=1911536 RepID=A0ABS7CTB0_9BACT|nr:OmpA family protein [Pontibacter aydingkolensis]MBW7467095.1 OmpA family protein [Pontibacter aydingkolensis]